MPKTPKPIDDGGPAFPVMYPGTASGMSLRAYAAVALLPEMLREDEHQSTPGVAAANTLVYVDALLAELDKDRTDATDEG